MPTFAYQAINEKGETLKGHIEAESADAAADLLRGKRGSAVRAFRNAVADGNLDRFRPWNGGSTTYRRRI